jgi:hypothetical protein
MYARWSPWSSNIYDQKNIHDYLNLFNLNLNFLYQTLVSNDIRLVIFNRSPHLGGDFLLYLLAENMGIRTLILDQSKFPNKFFHFFNFWDYGDFSTSKTVSPKKEVTIEKTYKKKLWYMDELHEKKRDSIRNFARRKFSN